MVVSYRLGTTETSALNRHSTLRKIPNECRSHSITSQQEPTLFAYAFDVALRNYQSAIISSNLCFFLQVFSPTFYTLSRNRHVSPFPPYLAVFFPVILCVQYQTRISSLSSLPASQHFLPIKPNTFLQNFAVTPAIYVLLST